MDNDQTTPPEGTFARLMAESHGEVPPAPSPAKKTSTNDRPHERTPARANVRTSVPAEVEEIYAIVIPNRREKFRTAFDIFRDQKAALDKPQLATVDAGAERPSLGEMVQDAIDAYIKRRVKELTNTRLKHERSNDRSDARSVGT